MSFSFFYISEMIYQKCYVHIAVKCDIIIFKKYLCIKISAKYKKGDAKVKNVLPSFSGKFIMWPLVDRRVSYMRSSC